MIFFFSFFCRVKRAKISLYSRKNFYNGFTITRHYNDEIGFYYHRTNSTWCSCYISLLVIFCFCILYIYVCRSIVWTMNRLFHRFIYIRGSDKEVPRSLSINLPQYLYRHFSRYSCFREFHPLPTLYILRVYIYVKVCKEKGLDEKKEKKISLLQ